MTCVFLPTNQALENTIAPTYGFPFLCNKINTIVTSIWSNHCNQLICVFALHCILIWSILCFNFRLISQFTWRSFKSGSPPNGSSPCTRFSVLIRIYNIQFLHLVASSSSIEIKYDTSVWYTTNLEAVHVISPTANHELPAPRIRPSISLGRFRFLSMMNRTAPRLNRNVWKALRRCSPMSTALQHKNKWRSLSTEAHEFCNLTKRNLNATLTPKKKGS